jgi:hypothetical protein
MHQSNIFANVFKGECGTPDALTSKDLDYIFNKTPEAILDNNLYKFKLGQFVLTYGRCAANREHIQKLMTKEQCECYIKDTNEEKRNAFRCFCDFLTKSDLAFVWYQFDNCEPDLLNKRSAPENRNVQFFCKTKHTSGNRKVRCHG